MVSKTSPKEWRYRITKLIFILVFGFIISRLFQIQVLNHSKYSAEAREQQWDKIPIFGKRGDIVTSDSHPIATTKTVYDLFLDGNKNDSIQETIETITSENIEINPKISERLLKKKLSGGKLHQISIGILKQKSKIVG
jgi:stage V sporulation protein D (sporulation-specific penicillin-binding protein)